MKLKTQFGLTTFFAWITTVCAFLGTWMWVFNSTTLGTAEDIPLVYVLGSRSIAIGLLVTPLFIVSTLVGIVTLLLAQAKYTISGVVFVGMAGVAIAITVLPSQAWYSAGYRIFLALVLCTIGCAVETKASRLGKWHWAVTGMAAAATMGYYFHVACLLHCIQEY